MAKRLGVVARYCGRRVVVGIALAMSMSACGGPSSDGASTVVPSANAPFTNAPSQDPAATPAAEPTAAPVADATVPAAPVATPAAPTSTPTAAPVTPAAAAFSWTKPAGFDALLQAEIQSQAPFMGGYGGQIPNPFPRIGDTTSFSSMQITRVDAITLDQFFGKWAYRFAVDAGTDLKHSNGWRAEFIGQADYSFVAGDTFNFKWSTYFSDEYKNSAWTDWNMFAQFHCPDFAAWGLHTAGGYLMMGPPDAAADALRVPMPARNAWHDFDWSVHWANDSSGWATLRIDGTLVFDYHGKTIHDGETTYYPKFGSYLANNPYSQVTYSTPWTITRL